MKLLAFPLLGLSLLFVTGCVRPSDPARPPAPGALEAAVERARAKHHLPAIAAASFSLGTVDVAASGVRRLGQGARVTTRDLFHVGSLAKGMTATAIGTLVDRGVMSWSLTLADAFPELASTMHPAYRTVTLAELLQNRAGVPGLNDLEDFMTLPEFAGDGTAQRRAFAGWLLAQAPAVDRGTYLYSTAGFALAAAMAECRSGRSWEALVREEVLAPLGASMFVGWPLEAGPNEPCGHMLDGSTLRAVDPSEGHIPAALAPGGDVSMTVGDFAKYAQLHLRALCGQPGLLADSTWTRLHTPVGDYAMGWSVLEGGGNTVLTHTGNPATFYAVVVLYRNQRHGFVVLVNADTPDRDEAVAEIIQDMAPTLSGARPAAVLACGASR